MALILVVIGMIIASWGLLYATLVDHTWASGIPMLVFGGGFVLPAVPLWFLDERLGRALVPMPKLECPRCRYSIIGLERPVCPECGLTLPMQWVGCRSNSEA